MISSVTHANHDDVEVEPVKPQSTCKYRNIKPRSEAQQRASRINGSKSKGPKTLGGKARSRRNAVKHGLRASKLSPPADVRGLDEDYTRIHEELVHEFEPVTFTERHQVENLARGIQGLQLANQMIDALTTPSEFGRTELKERYQSLRGAQGREQLVGDLLAALKSGETPEHKPEDADQLAGMIIDLVASVEEDLADGAVELAELEVLEDRGELCDLDHDNLSELRGLQEQQRLINRCPRALSDADRLAQAFRGEREVKKTERRVLIELFKVIHHHAFLRTHDDQNVLGCLKRAAEGMVIQLASDPDQLIKLEGYRERLEHSIRRQVIDLKASCG